VHFVVAPPNDTPINVLEATSVASSFGAESSMCGHHRLAVPVTRDGEMAVLQLPDVLPDLPPGQPSPIRPPPPPSPGHSFQDFRARTIHVQVSVSQTSRDEEPVLAMSMAWASLDWFLRVGDAALPPP